MENEKRLIDANAVIKEIDNYYHNSPFPHPGTTWLRGLELAVGLLLREPTVDAVEVVHGRWEDGDCTACGFDIRDMIDGESDFRNWVWEGIPYCPNCGAKMDGDGNA